MSHYKILIGLLSISLAFVACKKEGEEVAEKLEGTWEFERILKSGSEVDENSLPQDVTFDNCDITEDDVCSGKWVASNGDEASINWIVDEDGEMLSLELESASGGQGQGGANEAVSDLAEYGGDWQIQEHSETKFVIDQEEKTIEWTK
jgi:hypothetical protein